MAYPKVQDLALHCLPSCYCIHLVNHQRAYRRSHMCAPSNVGHICELWILLVQDDEQVQGHGLA